MQGVMRHYIRRQIDRHARQRVIGVRYVEFCSNCGIAHDRTGRRDKTICGSCAGSGRRKASGS